MKIQTINNRAFITLLLATVIAGVSQGMLLSLLAVILENQGVSSATNSLNALALYIGMLLANPFLEYPVRRFGYKPMILLGVGLILVSTLFFPIWTNLVFWMGLRFLVGVGDSMIHFSTQTWVISTALPSERGRKISLYGFSYGLGFGIGPLGINLLKVHMWAPFIALILFYLFVGWLVIKLKNDYPAVEESSSEAPSQAKGFTVPHSNLFGSILSRYGKVFTYSWFALIPTFLFGYLEASLNNNFPVYGLRTGISAEWVSILISSFIIGGLLVQIPLGMISDRLGRRRILLIILTLGGVGFGFVPFLIGSEWMLLITFIGIGGLVGSTFSLGVAYAADLLPPSLLANFNIMAGTFFGVGSMMGVYFNGLIIEFMDGNYMFYIMSAVYLISALIGLFFKTGVIADKEITMPSKSA